MMSTTMDSSQTVETLRKRPKETLSKAETARIPFGNEPVKMLAIPVVFNKYNLNILQVN